MVTNLPIPGSDQGLSTYFREIKKFPMLSIEEEDEVVEKESVIEPILRQELSNYLVPALVDEVVYNLSDIIDIYEEKADIKPVEIR